MGWWEAVEVSPGDPTGPVVFLWLGSCVRRVLRFGAHVTSHVQTSSTRPTRDMGVRWGWGLVEEGAYRSLPRVTSPPPLSNQRALVLPGLTHRASKTGNNSQ